MINWGLELEKGRDCRGYVMGTVQYTVFVQSLIMGHLCDSNRFVSFFQLWVLKPGTVRRNESVDEIDGMKTLSPV
jgi:hypothetical protein